MLTISPSLLALLFSRVISSGSLHEVTWSDPRGTSSQRLPWGPVSNGWNTAVLPLLGRIVTSGNAYQASADFTIDWTGLASDRVTYLALTELSWSPKVADNHRRVAIKLGNCSLSETVSYIQWWLCGSSPHVKGAGHAPFLTEGQSDRNPVCSDLIAK